MSNGTTTTTKPTKPTTKHPGGRPSMYSTEIADEICAALEAGETLIAIAERTNMPTTKTIRQWMREDTNGEFRSMSARARENGADALVAEATRLLENATKDDIAIVREKVSHLRWRAARLNPARYGDRSQVEIGGELAVPRKPSDDAPPWIREQLEARAAAAALAAVKKNPDNMVH